MFPWRRRRSLPGPSAPAAFFEPPAPAEPPGVPLGEVAGALLTQLTLAQGRADEAAVQCGEAYRQHPWLTRLPVPSVGIETVEVDLRVAMVQPGSTGGAEVRRSTFDDEAHAGPGALHVLFTAAQLHSVPPELISTVRLKLRCTPRRLVEVDGQTLLLP